MTGDPGLVKNVSTRYIPFVDTLRLHTLLERLGTLIRADLRKTAAQHGLPVVQLEALHYLALCNRYSDTPAAVAEFFGATKGTTSQTLRALESKGLITKRTDSKDGRVTHCRISRKGRSLVGRTLPSPLLRGALTHDSAPESDELGDQLAALLRVMQRRGEVRSFGVCHSCVHFRPGDRDDAGVGLARGGFRCGLTGDPLSADDSERICREHERPDEVASTPDEQ